MHCNYCRSWNADDEHRCSRCGRRLTSVSTATENYPASRSAPALAHAQAAGAVLSVEKPAALPRPARNPQKLSFSRSPPSNVIPFESFAAERIQPSTPSGVPDPRQAPPTLAGALRTTARNVTRRRPVASKLDSPQAGLDFLTPAPSGPRTLKTKVEAVIYCDADVAAPRYRVIAAALDGGMIFCGFAVFLFTFHLMGGMFRLN